MGKKAKKAWWEKAWDFAGLLSDRIPLINTAYAVVNKGLEKMGIVQPEPEPNTNVDVDTYVTVQASEIKLPKFPKMIVNIPQPPPKALYLLQKFIKNDPKAFDGLYGIDHIKQTICNYAKYFDPEWHNKMKEKIWNSEVEKKAVFLIFSGPPGSGKTELAKRSAQRYGIPMLVVEGGHIRGNNAGDTSERLQKLRKKIKEFVSCVVLFDEIENFAGKANNGSVRSQFRQLIEGPINEFKNSNVIFIGTTNQIDQIDLDIISRAKVIHFNYPDINARIELIKKYDNRLTKKHMKELAEIADLRQLSCRDQIICAKDTQLLFGWDPDKKVLKYLEIEPEILFNKYKEAYNLKGVDPSYKRWFMYKWREKNVWLKSKL